MLNLKAQSLINIADAVGIVFRELFLLLDGGISDTQKSAINKTIEDFAKCEQNAIHNLRKVFE